MKATVVLAVDAASEKELDRLKLFLENGLFLAALHNPPDVTCSLVRVHREKDES